MELDHIVVFTDGAAKGNPGPGGWAAIVVTRDGVVTERGGGVPYTTNNKMEIGGAIHALEFLRGRPGRVLLNTDSTYLIEGITKWIHGWRRRGWRTATGTPVLNRELWENLSELVAERGKENAVDWRHVRGHAGIPGNERCDEIAVAFSQGETPVLYDGPLLGYPVPILSDAAEPVERAAGAKSTTKRIRNSGKPYSYLSLLDGVPMRHSTWPDCDRRVKGQSGARFKKAMSRDEEVQILRRWGLQGHELG